MQTSILAALLCGCAFASVAVAETLVVNDGVQVRESQLERPKRGLTMDQVEKQFGAAAADYALGLQRLLGGLRARSRHRFRGHRLVRDQHVSRRNLRPAPETGRRGSAPPNPRFPARLPCPARGRHFFIVAICRHVMQMC